MNDVEIYELIDFEPETGIIRNLMRGSSNEDFARIPEGLVRLKAPHYVVNIDYYTVDITQEYDYMGYAVLIKTDKYPEYPGA